ncbi:hypothetical protein IV102_32190 [bacterium]|nr:hypothetical protein [bacterium]
MKRLLAVCLLLTLRAGAQPTLGPHSLELVESVPLETESALDDPEIRSTQQVWLEMVEGARDSLDLEFFYLRFEPKTSLEPIVQAIEKAKARGVRVRVLVDAKFLVTYPELCARWSQLGLDVRKIKFESGVQHTKMLLADGDQVFLGSQNFDWTALSHIRELGLHARDPRLVGGYQEAFEHDWKWAGGEETVGKACVDNANHPIPVTAYGQQTLVYPVFSPAKKSWTHANEEESALVSLLQSATKSIQLQVMSYSPVVVSYPGDGELPKRYEKLDIELRAAAARGVQVQLLVSDWGTKPPHLAALQAMSTVPHVEIKVSRIPPWSGGEIPFSRVGHSKYLVIDGERGWIGTSNWEYSYFNTSRDMGLVYQGAALAQKALQFFERDWNGPYVKDLSR